MERESFEDASSAEILNADFISIKVDREERPDIDNIYMSVCQMITGSGGWPLSIFLTPEQKPFFAGTYFPKESRYGMNGFKDILNAVGYHWANNRDELLSSIDDIMKSLEVRSENSYTDELDENIIRKAYGLLAKRFDKEFGGFGSAPKFPSPHIIYFLLRYYYAYNDQKALEMAEKTLNSMYEGGIYDHIGFGFSRYSTDRYWLVPHFEKMLYDNALLSIAYTECYQITKNELYKKIAKNILDYIIRDMKGSDGGFFTAEDADSEGVEGKFYVWDYDEITRVLGEKEGERFCRIYNISEGGNFEGKNIPNLIYRNGKQPERHEELSESINKLFEYRKKRVHPFKDKKLLTSLNGMMIAAMSFAGRVFADEKYIEAAKDAVTFVFENLISNDGRLLSGGADKKVATLAFACDYSYMIWGLIEAYTATADILYLSRAKRLNDDYIKYFWDDKNGGGFMYGSDSPQLIARPKEAYDGAYPSANSVSVMNFLKLAMLTDDPDLESMAMETIKAFSGEIYESGGLSSVHFISGLMYLTTKSKGSAVLAGPQNNEMERYIGDMFLPFTTIKYDREEKNYKALGGRMSVYICKNYSCSPPVQTSEQLLAELSR